MRCNVVLTCEAKSSIETSQAKTSHHLHQGTPWRTSKLAQLAVRSGISHTITHVVMRECHTFVHTAQLECAHDHFSRPCSERPGAALAKATRDAVQHILCDCHQHVRLQLTNDDSNTTSASLFKHVRPLVTEPRMQLEPTSARNKARSGAGQQHFRASVILCKI